MGKNNRFLAKVQAGAEVSLICLLALINNEKIELVGSDENNYINRNALKVSELLNSGAFEIAKDKENNKQWITRAETGEIICPIDILGENFVTKTEENVSAYDMRVCITNGVVEGELYNVFDGTAGKKVSIDHVPQIEGIEEWFECLNLIVGGNNAEQRFTLLESNETTSEVNVTLYDTKTQQCISGKPGDIFKSTLILEGFEEKEVDKLFKYQASNLIPIDYNLEEIDEMKKERIKKIEKNGISIYSDGKELDEKEIVEAITQKMKSYTLNSEEEIKRNIEIIKRMNLTQKKEFFLYMSTLNDKTSLYRNQKISNVRKRINTIKREVSDGDAKIKKYDNDQMFEYIVLEGDKQLYKIIEMEKNRDELIKISDEIAIINCDRKANKAMRRIADVKSKKEQEIEKANEILDKFYGYADEFEILNLYEKTRIAFDKEMIESESGQYEITFDGKSIINKQEKNIEQIFFEDEVVGDALTLSNDELERIIGNGYVIKQENNGQYAMLFGEMENESNKSEEEFLE